MNGKFSTDLTGESNALATLIARANRSTGDWASIPARLWQMRMPDSQTFRSADRPPDGRKLLAPQPCDGRPVEAAQFGECVTDSLPGRGDRRRRVAMRAAGRLGHDRIDN